MEQLEEQVQSLVEHDTQEQEDQTTNVQKEQVQQVAQQKQEQATRDKEENFRFIRSRAEQAERLQKERDEAIFKLREYESRYNQQQPQQTHADESFSVEDDGLVEGKHLKMMYNHIKKLETQLNQQTQASTTIAVEARLKAQYPDIDAVLSKENIDILRETEPEFVQTIDADTNSYTKLVSAYKFIKNSGIYKDSAMYKNDIDRIQNNAKKPKALSSIPTQQGTSPLNNANAFASGLTPELKKRLADEVQKLRGGFI